MNFVAPVFEVRGLGLEGRTTQTNSLGAEQPKTAWKQTEFLDNPRTRIQSCSNLTLRFTDFKVNVKMFCYKPMDFYI